LVSVYSIAHKITSLLMQLMQNSKLVNHIFMTVRYTQVSDAHRSTLVGYYFPQALDIYQELNAGNTTRGGS